MTGPFNGTDDETTAVCCFRMNIRLLEPALGTCARLWGSSSRLVTFFGPAEVSMHSPRARNRASSQRGVMFAGARFSAGGGGGGGTYLGSPVLSSAGVTIQ